MSNTNPFHEDAADVRHNQGAMDRHAEVVGGTPITVDREQLRRSVAAGPKNLTEWAETVNAAPPSGFEQGRTLSDVVGPPLDADSGDETFSFAYRARPFKELQAARAAIKEALRGLLTIDVLNDDDEGITAKLRVIADGLIEAL